MGLPGGIKLTILVVYKDMKVGFLADDTDHGTRELREIFKGESSHLDGLLEEYRLELIFSRWSSSGSGVPSGS